MLRRDDGAALVLLERLGPRLPGGIACLGVHQLTPELAPELADECIRRVFFVDARDARGEPDGALFELSPVAFQGPAAVSGHRLSPGMLLGYLQLFRRDLPPAWLLTLPGRDFGYGAGLSEQTRRAVDEALGRLPAWLEDPERLKDLL